ncbi:MAG: histidine kinase dimerization/phosphoacceptor domain -containing protein [Spirochaetia bacterium]
MNKNSVKNSDKKKNKKINKILVVDNNPVMLEFMNEVLSSEGYTVQTVDNGVEALKICRTFTPDVIFVDLIMPYIDGRQLCALLRKQPELSESSIVLISAIAAEEPDFDFSEIADAYLAKMPFRIMKPYVLDLLQQFQKNSSEISKKIIGLDQIYHRDITKELLFSKQHIEVLLSSISDGFFELNLDLQVIYVNDAGASMLDLPREKLLTLYFPSLFPPELANRIKNIVHSLNGKEFEIGIKEPIQLGDKHVRIRFNAVSYGNYRSITVMIQDISSQKEAERIVREDLKEKELLLKEVHHRVKNNLHVIASLLSLQTSFIPDKVSRKHLTESRNRVESMALIHEQLYYAEDLSGVYLDNYLSDLIAQLVNIYDTHPAPVKTVLDIPTVQLNLSVAVPLGLIINELISNSLEHGLKNKKNGLIEISLTVKEQHCRLLIHDNGHGLPEGFIFDESESLGLLIISNLADQLNGSFELYNDNGATAVVEFSLLEEKPKLT